MVGSWSDMNQGSRTGEGTAFMVCRRPEELYPGGDRASVVALKWGNAPWSQGRQEGGSVKDRTVEQQPSAVPEKAQQGGDIRARWAWVEPAVWTERRLATLETGIEGGKWFRLIDKVWSPRNLDGYVRGRLRSILRRRSKRKGRAKGRDNSRWPNTYFTTAGLFSLKQAHAAACRSS